MTEGAENVIIYGISKIGEGVSWVTKSIIKWVAQYGYNITALQSKVLTLFILGVSIYVVLGLLNIAKKLLKWGIIIVIIFLMFSVLLNLLI